MLGYIPEENLIPDGEDGHGTTNCRSADRRHRRLDGHADGNFRLDGPTYEIDLNDEHAADLREVMSVYVGAARRAGSPAARGPSATKPPKSFPAAEADPKAVRAWAEAQGIEVNARGRIRADVLEKFKAAN